MSDDQVTVYFHSEGSTQVNMPRELWTRFADGDEDAKVEFQNYVDVYVSDMETDMFAGLIEGEEHINVYW